MNKGHKLVKNKKKEAKTVQKINKVAITNLLLICLFSVILGLALYTPVKYSTAATSSIVRQLTDAITGTLGGIAASTEEVELEGYDFNVKSSQNFIMENGDKQLDYLERFAELGILDSNVTIDDLWAIYYTYFSEDYAANIGLYQQIVAWYSNLDKEDNGEYVNTCVNENCKFVQEMGNIIALDTDSIINSNAHATYHNQVAQSEQSIELSEEDMHQVYESYILTTPEHIDNLTIRFTLLNQRLLEEKPDLANWALNTDSMIVNCLLGKIKYSVKFDSTDIAEVMRYINTALDDAIITDEIVAYVPNSLLSYGVDADGLSTGITTVVNVTGVENLEEWLKNYKPGTYYKNITTDEQFIDLGFAKLYWDIESIDYADNIPTYEQCMSDTDWLLKVRTDLVEQAVWSKFYAGE